MFQKPWVSQNFGQNSRVSQPRFSNGDARLAVSIFFTNLSRRIDFIKAKKAAKYRFVYILHMSLNNVAKVEVEVKKSKCLGGLPKKNAGLALSQSLAFTIYHPYSFDLLNK